jgi:hypothetical protein
MALVNQQRRLIGLEGLFLPNVWFLRIPYLSREYLGLIVLNDTLAPSRDTLAFSPIPLHLHFVKVSVLDSLL